MTIRTNPPGAQVFVDNQEIGITPCSTSFVYYGTREITIVKDGYKTEKTYQPFSPPWYQYPPLDFASEDLVPYEIRDERYLDFELKPQTIVEENDLRSRAEGLRRGVATGRINTFVPTDGNQLKLPGERSLSPPLSSQQGGNFSLPGQGLPGAQPVFNYQ